MKLKNRPINTHEVKLLLTSFISIFIYNIKRYISVPYKNTNYLDELFAIEKLKNYL